MFPAERKAETKRENTTSYGSEPNKYYVPSFQPVVTPYLSFALDSTLISLVLDRSPLMLISQVTLFHLMFIQLNPFITHSCLLLSFHSVNHSLMPLLITLLFAYTSVTASSIRYCFTFLRYQTLYIAFSLVQLYFAGLSLQTATALRVISVPSFPSHAYPSIHYIHIHCHSFRKVYHLCTYINIRYYG